MSDSKVAAADAAEKAKLAEHAEQFEDMVEYVTEMANAKPNLDPEERNLLSVAFKNAVGSRRHAWRNVQEPECPRTDQASIDMFEALAAKMREKIEKELVERCHALVKLVDSVLLPAATEPETLVFYHKMKGDYYRYLAEIDRQEDEDEAAACYQTATEEAAKLDKTDAVRLGLALNYSVFLFEIRNEKAKACELAKDAFDAAIEELDNLPDAAYKDATLIMQLIRDNLALWNNPGKE